MNILLVDDSMTQLQFLTAILGKKGHKIFTAKTGREALDLLAVEKIDSGFCNINMPEMSGLEMLQEIKRKGLSIPFVVLSSAITKEHKEMSRDLSVVAFAGKPISAQQVSLLVDHIEKKMIKSA